MALDASAQRPAADYFERNGWPDPGWPYSDQPALLTGLFAVACGQVAVIAYHYVHLRSNSPRIQKAVMAPSSFWADAAGHLAQPEGFFLLGSYLAGTWMFRIMPESYYSGEGGVSLWHLFLQLAINDFLQTVMHLAEHKVSPAIYKVLRAARRAGGRGRAPGGTLLGASAARAHAPLTLCMRTPPSPRTNRTIGF
jgi:hypothetical protein